MINLHQSGIIHSEGRRWPRVGVDCHVVDGKFQGSRTHVIELFSRVITAAPEIEFVLYLDQPERLTSLSPAFAAPNVHVVRMPAAGALKRSYWDLPSLSRKYGLDVLHTQYILPAPVECKRVVTIHDILCESYPEYFSNVFIARSKLLWRAAARRADHVFTVSEFSRNDICDRYGISRDRISVIYNGVDYQRFSLPGTEDGKILSRRHLVKNNYILSVGRLEPRKNHVTLLEAYAALDGDAPLLVIVGQRDFRFDGIFETCQRLKLGNRIRIIEDVSDYELPALYRGASVFAYPAVVEGFGIPVVEAMAAGVPVVTSDRGALPEITGKESALLVDPLGVDELAFALERVLSDTSLQSRLVRAGRERARRFTWEEPALSVRSSYLNLM